MLAIREDEREALELYGLSDLLNASTPETHHDEHEDDNEGKELTAENHTERGLIG